MQNLKQVTDMISAIMYSDSHVKLNKRLLSAALEIDFLKSERFPTEQEAEQLICGDDDGEIPPNLVNTFAATSTYLAAQF